MARDELYYIFGGYVVTQLGIAVYLFYHFNNSQRPEEGSSCNKESSDKASDEGNLLSNHFLGDKNTGSLLLLLTTFSTTFSGYTLVGVPEMAYLSGFVGLVWIPWILSYILSIIVVTPRLRVLAETRGYQSPIDFITDRYHNESLRIILLVGMWVCDLIYLSVQFISISTLTETLTLGRVSGLLASIFFGFLILILEYLGGLKSVMLTDGIQSSVMIFVFVTVPFVLTAQYGSFEDQLHPADCSHAKPGQCGITQLQVFTEYPSSLTALKLACNLFQFSSFAILPQFLQRIYAASSSDGLKTTMLGLNFAPFLTMIPSVFTGVICAAQFNGEKGIAFGIISGAMYDIKGFSRIIACIFMCSAFAGISSTADSCVIAMSQLAAEDVYRNKWKLMEATDRDILIFSKVHSFIIVAVAIAISAVPDYNFAVAADTQTGIQILLYPSLLLGLFPDFFGYTPSSRSQILGIYAGFAVAIILLIVKEVAGQETYLTAPVWGFMVMTTVMIIIEKFDYIDDNTRKNDVPHPMTLKHILDATENVQSRVPVVKVGAMVVNPITSPALGDMAPKAEVVKDVAPFDGNGGKFRMPARLQDQEVFAAAQTLRREPLADATASGDQPVSNRTLVGMAYILLYLGLPWWQPGQQAHYTGGFPDWTIVMVTFSAISSVVVGYTLWFWQNPSQEVIQSLMRAKSLRELKSGVEMSESVSENLPKKSAQDEEDSETDATTNTV